MPNGMGINEVGMVNGAMSRKVEITLNSAVSLVQMLQPILFIPCYGIGCPIRWFPPFKWAESKGQLYHNLLIHATRSAYPRKLNTK